MTNFYLIATIISFVASVLFIIITDRKVLFYNASFFLFVFIGNLGYFFLGNATTVGEAILANKITYITGCLLPLFLMMLVFDACKIMPSKMIRLAMYGLNGTVMILAMTVGYTDWFYKECHIEKVNGLTILVKEYGPAHNLFLIMLYGYLLTGITLLVSSLIRRKNLIYKNVLLLLCLYIVTVLCYAFGRKIFTGIDPVCISYCINDIIFLFVTYNTSLYNLDEALLASIEKQDYQGFLLFDKKFNFVGCNDVAVQLIPEFGFQPLGRRLDTSENELFARILNLVESYHGDREEINMSSHGQDIEVSVQYLYKVNQVRGYIVRLTDDSKQQEYIRQLDMISTNKSNFLSNVSHEIRTPINSVLGMNEMILRECEDSKIREYALNIASSGKTLLQLINDVLDLSKIESGKLEVIPLEYNLADIIHDLETMIRPLIKTDSIKLHIETSENLPKTLSGDAIRVKQMVTNILTNAVKYTEKGSILFRIDGDRIGDSFVFRYIVKDTGKGIKESDIGNLFNAFERVDQLKNSGIEGTGLGLAITRKFALLMGGDITVESTYGEGSTFTVVVPQKVMGEELMGDYHIHHRETVHKAYTESFHAKDAKLLAVDDVKMNLMVLKGLLKRTQVQITCCSSGKECIEAVKKEHFDMILLDHMMPELDGVETLELIRREHYCDDTPIIALTANADIKAKDQYLAFGFTDYLSKPIDPPMLEKIILEHLPQEKIEGQ